MKRPKRKQCHTVAPQGAKIRVTLVSGETFIDKFTERKAKTIIFQNRTVKASDVRGFVIHHTPIERVETLEQKIERELKAKLGKQYNAKYLQQAIAQLP